MADGTGRSEQSTEPEPSPDELARTVPRAEASLAPAAVTALAREQPGRYELRGELGRGGQSIVYRAWDAQLDREVAIKELRSDQPAAARERFLHEARITARLEHPNIVPVYEIGERADGTLYCVQRLVHSGGGDGQTRTLRRALSEAKTLGDRLALLPNFVGVCQGVGYAHAQGVLHRDLKPENVVLGRFGETIILDWGLARAPRETERALLPAPSSPQATLWGVAYGTPKYMSPEQARGETTGLDERSDVYSLGAVLFEILTGCAPFLGASAAEILQQVLEAPLVDARRLEPAVPPALAAVARRALEKQPAQRYPSAQALADEVIAWQSGQRVSVYDYSVPELVRLFVTRHRSVSAVTLAALVAVTALGVVAFGRYTAARQAIAHVLVERAREADRALQWDRAAVLYAAARVKDDNPETQWGVRISGGRHFAAPLALEGHSGGSKAAAWAPDSQWLATGDFAGKVRVFSMPKGALETSLDAHQGTVNSVAWSGDGKWLATVGEDGRALLWETSGWSVVDGGRLVTGGRTLNRVAFSRDSRWVAIAAEDGWVEVLDVEARQRRARFVVGKPVYSVAFHPSLEQVAVVTWDGRLEVRSLDGALAQSLEEVGAALLDVAYSPDGRWLAAAGRDTLVRLRPVDARGVLETRKVELLKGHASKVNALAFSEDSTLLASGSYDRTTRLWRVADGQGLVGASIGGALEIQGLAFAPDGKHLALGGASAAVDVYSLPEQSTLGESVLRRADLATAPGVAYFATRNSAGPVVYDAPTMTRLNASTLPILKQSMTLSRDGRFVAWACAPDQVCVTTAPDLTGLERFTFPLRAADSPTADNWLNALALAKDGAWVAAADATGQVRLWPRAAGRPALLLQGHELSVHSLDASPDGALLASGSYDKTIRLWNPQTGAEVAVLRGHTHGVRRVRFSPDGKTLASTSWDGTVRLWDVASRAQRLVCDGHEDHVLGLDWAPDGTWLASAARDGTVRIWDAATCRPLAQLVADESQVFALGVWGDGGGLVYAGLSFHRFVFETLRDPKEQLAALEAATHLEVVGLEVLRKP
jgi:WD40 repeat protein